MRLLCDSLLQVLNFYWKVFKKSLMSPDDRLSSCWFQENDVDGSSWHLPGCSSLLWSSEQTLARSRQVTLDNSCNSSLGPFSSSISELQPTFKCIMLCKQILSIHFLLVHITMLITTLQLLMVSSVYQ